MINNVATKYGQSFAGVAAYLLHDKRSEAEVEAGVGADLDTTGQSRDRVAWTDTRNMATNDPDIAWRVMAANYMDRERRKEQNGVAKTGRKNKGPVAHISFSWHPEEAEMVNRYEMKRFANVALKRLGFQNLQTMIVCHDDEPQPHIHLLINRTDPQTGKMVNCYYEQDKLSKLALKYEKERGKVFCKQREENEKARKREQKKKLEEREAIRDKENASRDLHEKEQAETKDSQKKEALLKEKRQKAGVLKKRQDGMKAHQKKEFHDLETGHRQKIKEIDQGKRDAIRKDFKQIGAKYRPEWTALHSQQRLEEEKFEKDENRAIGKVRNVFKSIDFKSLLSLSDRQGGGQASTLKAVFKVMGDAGARLQAMKARHQAEEKGLHKQQQSKELQAAKLAEQKATQKQDQNRRLFLANRHTLVFKQRGERVAMNARWKQHNKHFEAEWNKIAVHHAKPTPEGRDQRYDKRADAILASTSDNPKQSKSAVRKTNPKDLSPEKNREQAAKQVDQHRQNLLDKTKDYQPDKNQDKEKDEGQER